MRTRKDTHETAAAAGTTPRSTLRRWLTRSTIATSAVAMFFAGSVALAAWNVTGSGEGAAGAANADVLDEVSVTIAASLYPGLTTDATLAVKNPNLFPVRITDIEFKDLDVDDAPGCTGSNSQVVFTDITNVAGNTYFIDADAAESFLLEDVVTMGTGASDLCQGASFSVTVDLKAESTTP